MNELVVAASGNDLKKLRAELDANKIDPYDRGEGKYTYGEAMEAAVAAAHHDHPEALDIILDAGIWTSRGEDTIDAARVYNKKLTTVQT